MTDTTTRLLHEWRYRNGKVICHLCGHESIEVLCPKCGRSSSESTIGHGVLGGKMCSWRPADTPCIGVGLASSSGCVDRGRGVMDTDGRIMRVGWCFECARRCEFCAHEPPLIGDAVVVPVDLDGIDLDGASLVISDLATAWWTSGAHQLESPAEEGDREYAARWVKAVVRAALGIKEEDD